METTTAMAWHDNTRKLWPAKAGMIAGTVALNLVAGVALVTAGERAGSAHVTMPELLAARPALAAQIAADRAAFARTEAVSGAAALVAIAPSPPAALSTPGPGDRRFVIRRILPIAGAIRYGQWTWDEHGVPPGPLVITVDLQARVLSAFRDGYEIGTTAVLLGSDEKPTPTGVFPITQKDANHHSNIYDNAPMPYMMRLTNDGVTIHGDSVVANGYASHGCIGVPTPFAKKLFGAAHVGDRVYITSGRQVGIGDSLVDR